MLGAGTNATKDLKLWFPDDDSAWTRKFGLSSVLWSTAATALGLGLCLLLSWRYKVAIVPSWSGVAGLCPVVLEILFTTAHLSNVRYSELFKVNSLTK